MIAAAARVGLARLGGSLIGYPKINPTRTEETV